MNSPLTNKPMQLIIEKRRMKFRNDTFLISNYFFYVKNATYNTHAQN